MDQKTIDLIAEKTDKIKRKFKELEDELEELEDVINELDKKQKKEHEFDNDKKYTHQNFGEVDHFDHYVVQVTGIEKREAYDKIREKLYDDDDPTY